MRYILVIIRQRITFGTCVSMIIVILLLSSCSSADISDISDVSPEHVSLTVNISKQTPVTTATRAISDVIDNIEIMVFNVQGYLIGTAYNSATPTSVSVQVRASTGCTICAIANTGSSSYLDGVSTITELRSKVTTSVNSATALSEKTNEILYGETPGVNITTSTASQSVFLNRIYSKYTFTITPLSDIVITGYQLCNVPNECFIASGNSSNPTAGAGYSGLSYSSATTSASAGKVIKVGPYYVYENLAGKNNSLTTMENRTSANAPSGASYLLINAKKDTGWGTGWKSTYRIYLGGVTSTANPIVDCTDFNIYRNYDYNCYISISGNGEKDARVTYEPFDPIKEFLFSNGTFGKISDNPGLTPIAIIFSTTVSAADQAKNYHCYAMALNFDESASIEWANQQDTRTGSVSTTLNITDYDGLTYTGNINNSSYPAAYTATNFNSIVQAPSGTSGWYLPSIAQWYQICVNLGGAGALTAYTDNRTSGSLYWSGTTKTCVDAINTAMSAAGNDNYAMFSMGQCYWSSSEYDETYAYGVEFNITNDLKLNHFDKGGTYCVRPVIAF